MQVNDPVSSDDDSDRCSSPTPSKESNSQFLTVVKSFFTKDSEEFSPTNRIPPTRSGLSPSEAPMPRCKSAINATLSHLIMVPRGTTKLGRRAKSTADVQNFAFAQVSSETGEEEPPFESPRERRSSLSPMYKRKCVKNSDHTFKPVNMTATATWSKSNPKRSVSQPASPLTTDAQCHVVFPHKSKPTDSTDIHPLIPPEVRVTSQNDSMLDLPDDEGDRVQFTLYEDRQLT